MEDIFGSQILEQKNQSKVREYCLIELDVYKYDGFVIKISLARLLYIVRESLEFPMGVRPFKVS